jgi:hypothetical protein
MKLLQEMITEYDDGRSKSSFCLSAALLPTADLEAALAEAGRRRTKDQQQDPKKAAELLKAELRTKADKAGVELVYRTAKQEQRISRAAVPKGRAE